MLMLVKDSMAEEGDVLRGDCRAAQNDVDNGCCGSGEGVLFRYQLFCLKAQGREGELTVEFTVTVPVTVIVRASADLFTKSLLSISAALLARMSANLFLMLA
jgi:hypothetical protein